MSSTVYSASLAPLSEQAAAIHKSLKAKTLPRAQGVADLTELDRQRDAMFADAYAKLQLALGTTSWAKFEEFLDLNIKPNIVMAR